MEAEERENLTIRYQPENMLEIFNNAEENNIREIQNLHDKEDEVEGINKLYNKELSDFEKLREEKETGLAQEEKSLEKKTDEFNRLRDLKKNNLVKINILDN